MRIIFLDVDGVLNHSSTSEFFGPYIGIDTFNLACLAVLVEDSNKEEETKIVLSSSWRAGVNNKGAEMPGSYQYLTERLKEEELILYDETPILPQTDIFSPRGKEITTWLENHKDLNITSYVVLDDELFPDFKEYGITKRLVRTTWYGPRAGLTPRHIAVALSVLRRPLGEQEV